MSRNNVLRMLVELKQMVCWGGTHRLLGADRRCVYTRQMVCFHALPYIYYKYYYIIGRIPPYSIHFFHCLPSLMPQR